MANYQITNRTGAQVKAVLDKFTSTSAPNNLTLTGAISGTNLIIGTQKSGTTLGTNAVILGSNGTASGNYSHAEGYYIKASGTSSHAEGDTTTASGNNSHTEGFYTTASGPSSHAEGAHTTASKDCSHTEGFYTIASGNASHAEGGYYNSEGTGTLSSWGPEAGITINGPLASGHNSHAEGCQTYAKGYTSHAEGYQTIAEGNYSHAEGNSSTASGMYSHAEGQSTTASGNYSHAEGQQTNAVGNYSHTEGLHSVAYGHYASHAEGYGCIAGSASSPSNSVSAHAEGLYTKAYGNNASHAEGYYTESTGGWGSHAEGHETYAKGCSSHAEGEYTIADGNQSHAGGYYTIAKYANNMAIGRCNSDDIDAPLLIGTGLGGPNSMQRWCGFWIDWTGCLNVSPAVINLDSSNNTYTVSQATAGNGWIDATHNWDTTNPMNSALNIWDVSNDGGFHTWIRQRTANHHYTMGLIPSVNGFYIATNPAGANPAVNQISKMLNWNGSNGSLSISGSLSQGSDRRLKNIYGDITEEETLAILEGVNIVNYSYKYDDDVENNIRSGIIAQDLQQILEEHNIENRAYLTTINVPRNEALIESIENEEEEPWSEDEMTKEFLGISYVDLVPILIKGWQIHKQKMEELKEENRFLMRRLDELEDKINAITGI